MILIIRIRGAARDSGALLRPSKRVSYEGMEHVHLPSDPKNHMSFTHFHTKITQNHPKSPVFTRFLGLHHLILSLKCENM